MSILRKKILLFVGLLIVFYCAFFVFPNLGIIANSDSYWGINAYSYLKGSFFSWYDFLYGGVDGATPLLFGYSLASALNALGLNFSNAGVVTLVLLSIWLVTYNIASLVLQLNENDNSEKCIVFIASSFSIANEMVRTFLMTNITILWGMLLMYLTIYFYLKLSIQKKWRYLLISAILFNFSFIDFHSAVLSSMFIASFAAISFIHALIKKDQNAVLHIVKNLTLFLILALLLNMYWLANIIYNELHHSGLLSSYSSNTSATSTVLDMYNSYNSLAYNLMLSTKNVVRTTILDMADLVLTYVLVGCSLGSLFFIRKKQNIQIFYIALLALLFMSLGFGPLNPLGIFNFMWRHVPGFTLFRDFYKFYRLLIMLYVVLLSYFAIRIVSHKRLPLVAVLLTAMLMVKFYPYVVFSFVYEPYTVPSYYQNFQNEFQKNKEDSHITVMPIISSHLWFDWPDNPHYDVQDPLRYYPTKPIILNNAVSQEGPQELLNKQLVLSFANDKNKNLFYKIAAIKNIHYFVIRSDFSQAFINSLLSTASQSKDELDIQKLHSVAEHEKYIEKVATYGKLDLYKIKSPYYLPHVFVPIKSYISQKDAGSFSAQNFAPLIEPENSPINSVTFYQAQNDVRKNDLARLVQSSEKSTARPVLEYKKINPTKYRIRVHQAMGVFPLVFSESFHKNWVVYLKNNRSNTSADVDFDITSIPSIPSDEDQATREEVKKYAMSGWLSTVASSPTTPVQYISKNNFNTIQNDNLPDGSIFETWSLGKRQKNAVEIAKDAHFVANISSNAWFIDTSTLCKNHAACKANADGTYDMELILEYYPQQMHYIGIGISGITLFICILLIAFSYGKNTKRNSRERHTKKIS